MNVKKLYPEDYLEAAYEIIKYQSKLERLFTTKYCKIYGYEKYEKGFINLGKKIYFSFMKNEIKDKGKIIKYLCEIKKLLPNFHMIYGYTKPLNKESVGNTNMIYENEEISILQGDSFFIKIFGEDSYEDIKSDLKNKIKSFFVSSSTNSVTSLTSLED